MILTLFYTVALIVLCVFCALAAIYHVFLAAHSREQLVAHAEDSGADPEVLSDPLYRRSILVRWADRYDRSPAAAKDREKLRKSYLNWRPSTYRILRLVISLALFLVCFLVIDLPLLFCVLIVGAVYFIAPGAFLKSRHNAFLQAFEAQMVEINQLLANGLRAGMSIHQAIGHLVENIEEPAKSEFQQTYNEMMLGDDLVKALNALSERVGSRDLNIVLDAIVVQHQAGGNLAHVLHGMANTVTARRQLADEINAMTADIRYGVLVVTCVPVIILIVLRPSFLGQAIFDNPIGWVALGIYAVIQTCVVMMMRRTAKLDI
ncbi:MAG: type II secretion system F family protein [Chloroflexota bacterium]